MPMGVRLAMHTYAYVNMYSVQATNACERETNLAALVLMNKI